MYGSAFHKKKKKNQGHLESGLFLTHSTAALVPRNINLTSTSTFQMFDHIIDKNEKCTA